MSKTKIAKVILGITPDKEFDYSFDSDLGVKKGMRVLVDFRSTKRIGLVLDIQQFSRIKKIKPIINCLDKEPVVTCEQILFATQLSKVYPYSKGDFLFMMLPAFLKSNKKYIYDPQEFSTSNKFSDDVYGSKELAPNFVFVKSDFFKNRYKLWQRVVKDNLKNGSVLVCFPRLSFLLKAQEIFEKDFPGQVKTIYSQKKDIFPSWVDSRRKSLILGTRVSLMYYPRDLKLIIVEEESSPYYFQEEKPYHNLFDLALLLARLKKIQLIASSDLPSLETYKLIKENKVILKEQNTDLSKIKVIEIEKAKRNKVIGPIASELIRKAIANNKKALVVWNKKGFARVIICANCKYIVECEHCSGYLFSSLKNDKGLCPYCQRSVLYPKICPKCRSGYLKPFGFGVEKIRSIIKKLYPEARIGDNLENMGEVQVFISTSKILNSLYDPRIFDTGLLLDADSELLRIDYDATFKAFLYFKKLSLLCRGDFFIFTYKKDYYLFEKINKEWRQFYEHELALRKSLNLPPYGLIAKITIRSINEFALLKKAQRLYNKLKINFKGVYGPFKEHPFKLRDKYRYSVIVKAERGLATRKVIREVTKGLSSSTARMAITLH